MDIKNLIASTEVELEAAEQRMRRAKAEGALIIDDARKDGRTDLTPEEKTRSDELFSAFEMGRAQVAGIKDKLARARTIQAQEAEMDDKLAQPAVPAVGTPLSSESRATATVQVGREARTYSRETDPYGRMFLGDVINQFLSNDVRAADRLGRHIREEQVERASETWVSRTSAGVGTGAFSGLTVPQYLLDMVAPAVANMRPFADKANKHPLPAQGMSVNISRITTASTAALQAAELNAVSFTDMDDTLLTIPILTAAGQQLVSRQAIERGAGVEDVVLQDLMKRYNTVVDNTVINGATTGLNTIANNTAFTSASPTGPLLYPLIVGAVSQSATATRGYAKPDFALMHPRRWYWLQSQMVSTWPMFGQQMPDARLSGVNNDQAYNAGGWDGKLPCGVNVCIDANCSTDVMADASNWDAVYVGSTEEVHLWEDSGAPVFIRAEQPSVASLGVNLVVYGYFAYTMQRYSLAYQRVTGTGLLAPVGF
jgi:hypothetical protein